MLQGSLAVATRLWLLPPPLLLPGHPAGTCLAVAPPLPGWDGTLQREQLVPADCAPCCLPLPGSLAASHRLLLPGPPPRLQPGWTPTTLRPPRTAPPKLCPSPVRSTAAPWAPWRSPTRCGSVHTGRTERAALVGRTLPASPTRRFSLACRICASLCVVCATGLQPASEPNRLFITPCSTCRTSTARPSCPSCPAM